MVPEAWDNNSAVPQSHKDLYGYSNAVMEPWDGPAAVAFTDGRQIGATLDRNGLRPARYLITDDDLVVMASEMGVLPIPSSKIVKKWRLQPGKMFLIDMEQGRIIDDAELKDGLSNGQVGQRPFEMGYKAMFIMKDLVAGKSVEDPIYTGLDVCTAENADSCLVQ